MVVIITMRIICMMNKMTGLRAVGTVVFLFLNRKKRRFPSGLMPVLTWLESAFVVKIGTGCQGIKSGDPSTTYPLPTELENSKDTNFDVESKPIWRLLRPSVRERRTTEKSRPAAKLRA